MKIHNQSMHANISNFSIELTDHEQDLVLRIDFNPSPGKYPADPWKPIGDAMLELTKSLFERKAIPESRIKFFTDPQFFIGGHGISHLQAFEKNGTRGDDIFRHPHFLKYLSYFIYGPALPKAVIDAFQRKIADCGAPFTGSDALTVADMARQLTRSYGLAVDTTAEEFYKLVLDCGMDASDARTVRDTVKRVR
jgi:hypothetical protein